MLTPRWHKVIRDLWSNKTKTILVVLAMAVGLFAFGSVFITQDVLVADMNKQYQAIHASNIIINTSSFDSDVVRWAKRQPEVFDAQGQGFYIVKLIVGEESYNLYLNAYEDYSRISMDIVTPEKGSWPPGKREIVFERASLPLTKGDIGSKVQLEMSNGKRYELTIAGTAHDLNAFPANMFPMPTGYVSLETLELIGFDGLCNQLNIVSRPEFTTVPELEKISNDLKSRMQDFGYKMYGTQVRKADDHWAKEVTQSFIMILSVIGIFSLILSGFLVVNTITALLAQQRRQIGIMKAVGGTARQIIGLYLVLVGFYGLLALLLALPISLGVGYFFTSLVANLLNIDIIGFHLPLRVFILELVAALLVPVVAAALPILGGVRVTVRETLSNYGIGKSQAGLFDRSLMKIRFLSRPVLLSLRNTFRRKARLALTLGTLTLAGTLFITVMNVRSSLIADLDNTFRKYYDFQVELDFDGSYQGRGIETRVLRIPNVTQVESRATALVQRIKDDGTKGASFNVIGVPTDSKFMNPNIQSGRWLQTGDRNSIVLTSGLLKDMPEVKVGDDLVLEIDNTEYHWKVIGIIPLLWDKLGYADFNYVSRLKGEPGMATSLYISTEHKDATSQSVMAKILDSNLKKSGIKIGWYMTRDTVASSLTSRDDFLIYFLLMMAIMAAAIGALGLMGMMSLNVLERTREIGILRSIGASTRAVGGIVVIEGLIIGIISWIMALPISIPFSFSFNTMLGEIMGGQALPLSFSPIGLFFWLGIVIIISVVASLLPAYRAMRMSIRETLAYE